MAHSFLIGKRDGEVTLAHMEIPYVTLDPRDIMCESRKEATASLE